eukprot:SAG11_NODE_18921_length_478_cov_0.870712_2_plen_36_part_01
MADRLRAGCRITALGGGTVRDLLLGRSAVFWFSSTS